MIEDRIILLDEGEGLPPWSHLQRDKTFDDEENPVFLLSTVSTSLVRKIEEGKIDIVALAQCGA